MRLPNSHCCSLGWVWAAWELRAAELIEVVLSRVVLLGETVSIKIAREAGLPSDFEIVDCGIVYCTSTV